MNVCHQPIVVKWLYDSFTKSRGQERPNSQGLDTVSLLRNWKVMGGDFAQCDVVMLVFMTLTLVSFIALALAAFLCHQCQDRRRLSGQRIHPQLKRLQLWRNPVDNCFIL